jgi:sodium/potassium-transporting ATPase subunit alpha
MICKTRWLSIRQQGMTNPAMNFGLVFETVLGSALCYITPLGVALNTRPLRFTHWLPGIPFSVFIFLYDEIRKYLMRSGPMGLGSVESIDEATKRVTRAPGWLEKWTYY